VPLLSKSKIVAWRQCPRRLWLEVHRPELRRDSAAAQAGFRTGHEVGEAARRRYDPQGVGQVLDPRAEGWDAAFERTRALLADAAGPVFEASLRAGGALALADVMLPVAGGWRMVEVKSSTSVKDYHRDDVALQAFVARGAGVPLASVAVAVVDSGWVYPGGEDFDGLFVEHELGDEVARRAPEVAGWIECAARDAALPQAPVRATGAHCREPFECGFLAHCAAGEPRVGHPLAWLPGARRKALRDHVARAGVRDMADVPDDLLDVLQRRVKHATLAGQPWFDADGARADLAPHRPPALFLDFETAGFAVPRWAGTRPYQSLPFQFSVHRMGRDGSLEAGGFLDTSGAEPSAGFAEALLEACAGSGPIFVYNRAFEARVISALEARFAPLAPHLAAIRERLVDLHPIAQARWYHPAQQGSWSIKALLPTLAPDLDHGALDGVQDGRAAQDAYAEAIDPATPAARREALERQLREYCTLDTLALVRVWEVLSGARPAPRVRRSRREDTARR
jgi:hypothetical protein